MDVLHQVGLAPSVATVDKTIKDSRVPLQYGFPEVGSPEETARWDAVGAALQDAFENAGVALGSVVFVAAEDECCCSGAWCRRGI